MLLSRPLILFGFLLLNSSYTQATRKPDCRRQNHLLHRMPHAVLLCLNICGDRDIPVGSDGVRPIRGHLQPSSLHRCDVSEALLLIGGCIILLECSYSLIYTYFLSLLSFCGTKFINNFVCEHAAIVAVSWSDPYISQEIILVSATFNEVSSLVIILTSYVCVFITVLKMPSTGRRHRAFSTCASHLTAITIFHGSILFLYCVPSSRSSWLMVKVASVFYTVVIPMLNPLIYSLRNKDVKETARKLVNTKLLCQQCKTA